MEQTLLLKVKIKDKSFQNDIVNILDNTTIVTDVEVLEVYND